MEFGYVSMITTELIRLSHTLLMVLRMHNYVSSGVWKLDTSDFL